MLLTTAAILMAVGFVVWIGGYTLDHTAIAVIGAVIVVGVGASIANDGLERKTGVIEENVSSDTTKKTFQYTQVESPTNLPLGFLITLLGGLGVLHPLNRAGGGLS